MGSSKIHVLAWVKQSGFLPLQNLMHVDADLLRTRLPEWQGLVSLSPEKAGSLTRCSFCMPIIKYNSSKEFTQARRTCNIQFRFPTSRCGPLSRVSIVTGVQTSPVSYECPAVVHHRPLLHVSA
jgi:hypothetical protein